MNANDPAELDRSATTYEPENRITGPHPGEDQYGRIDHYFYRCTECGVESVDKQDLRWCC